MQLSGEGPVMPAGAVWAEWLVEENHVPRWESVCVLRTESQWSRSVLQGEQEAVSLQRSPCRIGS